jgi:ferredoxin
MNCLDDCYNGIITYQVRPSVSGEILSPDISRRAFTVSLFTGMAVIPAVRLGGKTGPGWNPCLVRPPGALEEQLFLKRCVKCGQCMRVCPTNVIHPDFYKSGLEGLWTPVLDFRIGSSGCQIHCVACGNICPTAAIRPITLDERMGKNQFSANDPVRIGTAFVDRGRCLPWAMDKPCIVCQENCPVSPKAIFTRPVYQAVRGLESLRVIRADSDRVTFEGVRLEPDRYANGDFFCSVDILSNATPRLIKSNTASELTIAPELPFIPVPKSGNILTVQVRLQRPYVDIEKCVGCGVCEHECPVKGKRAIRVTAENETRSRHHNLLLTFVKK